MPRKRHRSTSADIRFRNMLESSGLPSMAGRSRLGLKATKPISESVVSAPPDIAPLVFHWNGQVDRFVDTRNGPGEFGANGTIDRIRYRWDTAPAANATVTWRLDNVLTLTHTLTGGNDTHVEMPEQAYAQETIVSVVTAVGSDAMGLTAFVYFR